MSLISDFFKRDSNLAGRVYLQTHLLISLDCQTKQTEHPCRAADRVAVGWSKLCVGWYAPFSLFPQRGLSQVLIVSSRPTSLPALSNTAPQRP
jgi:hypothetical protein